MAIQPVGYADMFFFLMHVELWNYCGNKNTGVFAPCAVVSRPLTRFPFLMLLFALVRAEGVRASRTHIHT